MPNSSDQPGLDKESVLPRDSYVQLNCRLYRALVPARWDAERAHECALEDWRNDAGADDAHSLTQAEFFSSLCELAEVWTESGPTPIGEDALIASAAAEAAWLDTVFDAIAVPASRSRMASFGPISLSRTR